MNLGSKTITVTLEPIGKEVSVAKRDSWHALTQKEGFKMVEGCGASEVVCRILGSRESQIGLLGDSLSFMVFN